MSDHLLEIDRLRTVFATVDGVATAVDGVSFIMEKGEPLGIVGESGSGKSVTALSVMRLIRPPGKIMGGVIRFDGTDLCRLPEKEMQDDGGNRISMIFQEPMTSLNPLYTIGDQIAEMFIRHRGMNRNESRQRSVDMLDRVRIPSPAKRADEYPHQLSGGMRQRVIIAAAARVTPTFLTASPWQQRRCSAQAFP